MKSEKRKRFLKKKQEKRKKATIWASAFMLFPSIIQENIFPWFRLISCKSTFVSKSSPSFPQNRNLYKYMRVHSKVALFVSPLCFRSYSTMNHFPVYQKAVSVTTSTHMELITSLWVAGYVGFECCSPRCQSLFLTLDDGIREGAYQVSSVIIAWTPVMNFISVLLAFYDFKWDCEYFFLIIQIFGEEGFELPGRDYTFPCIRKFIQWKGSNY